jgi:hypothetical protein
VIDEVQGLVIAADPEPVRVVVAPTQAESVPDIVGAAIMVIVAVAVQLLVVLYVIVVVPTATGVTRPTFETVATVGADDTHGFVAFGVPEPVKVTVLPLQVVKVPVIVAPELMVTVAFTVQFAVFL